MDYIILLISDAYLKSANCMYEVLEVMRDRNYRDKIFPAIINPEIYKPIHRAGYVKYWENEFKTLEEAVKGIRVQNLGKLNEDLKRYQVISSNIAEFLDVVSDMNNPKINEVAVSIEEKLNSKGLLENKIGKNENDLFETLGIQKNKFNSEPTDLEVNLFMKESFNQIVKVLYKLCQQYQDEKLEIQVQFEEVDTRTVIFRFYKNGQLIRGLKLFLSNVLGRQESIGVSDCTLSYSSGNNSWNGMYNAKFESGQLKMYAQISLINNQKSMTTEAVAADIWKNYIQTYLER